MGGELSPSSNNNNNNKRQRRPSVRLGDIGGDTFNHSRSKPSSSSSKTRPLTNLLVNGANSVSRKRPRTHFLNTIEYHLEQQVEEDREQRQHQVEDNNFDKNNHQTDDDEEQVEEDQQHQHQQQQQSPVTVHSGDFEVWRRTSSRSITNNNNNNNNNNGGVSELGFRGLDEGVRKWLDEMGLSRYSPVFEIHEVDDYVLPHLTLDDLKDMGINAVGSRRKLYAAILNLRKGLS